MKLITLSPRSPLETDEPKYKFDRTARLLHEEDWAYYTANFRTGAQMIFAKFAWVVKSLSDADVYVFEEKEVLEAMPARGECEARNCTREAYVRVGHLGSPYCDWTLLVCAKHEEAARERYAEHKLECPEVGGPRYCDADLGCGKRIVVNETYQRVPGEPTKFIHVDCLTGDSSPVTVVEGARRARKTKGETRSMAKGVNGKKLSEADLPDDLEDDEVTPKGRLAADEEGEDEEEEEIAKPAKTSKKSAKAEKKKAKAKPEPEPDEDEEDEEEPAAKKSSKKAPAAKSSKKIIEKAAKATAKRPPAEGSRETVEKAPNGDTTVVGLIRGKEIRIRAHSHVIATWKGVEKNKAVSKILDRARYDIRIRSEDEADTLLAAAEKIAEGKNSPAHLAKAMTKFSENVERWRKEIRKFKGSDED